MPSALDPEPRLRPVRGPGMPISPVLPLRADAPVRHPGPYGTRSTESPAHYAPRAPRRPVLIPPPAPFPFSAPGAP